MASSSAQTIEAALLRSTPPHRLRHSCSADQLLLLTRHCSQGDEGDRECLQSALYPLSCIDVSSCSAQQRRLPQDLRWKPGSKESERADQLEMRRQTLRLLLQQHSPAHPLLPLVMRSLSQQMMDCEATRSPQQQQLQSCAHAWKNCLMTPHTLTLGRMQQCGNSSSLPLSCLHALD